MKTLLKLFMKAYYQIYLKREKVLLSLANILMEFFMQMKFLPSMMRTICHQTLNWTNYDRWNKSLLSFFLINCVFGLLCSSFFVLFFKYKQRWYFCSKGFCIGIININYFIFTICLFSNNRWFLYGLHSESLKLKSSDLL